MAESSIHRELWLTSNSGTFSTKAKKFLLLYSCITMTSQFDDEELSMSLSSPMDRRGSPRPPPPASQARAPPQQAVNTVSDLPLDGRAGQRIGQYSVKKTLGEGSFGKVKLAVHRVSGQEVALKIISRKRLISRDMAGRVEREIQYLQLLRHPHIIKLYVEKKCNMLG